MTTHLILIAHAPTAATRTAAFARSGEAAEAKALDRLGRAAARFAGLPALASPARAAGETARALRLDPVVEPALRDLDCGAWTGRSLEAIAAEDPEGLAAWLGDPCAAPHGGETVAALIARVAAWLDERRSVPERIVAITHAAVLRAAVVSLLEAPAQAFWRIDVVPGTATEMSSRGGRWRLGGLNLAL